MFPYLSCSLCSSNCISPLLPASGCFPDFWVIIRFGHSFLIFYYKNQICRKLEGVLHFIIEYDTPTIGFHSFLTFGFFFLFLYLLSRYLRNLFCKASTVDTGVMAPAFLGGGRQSSSACSLNHPLCLLHPSSGLL